MQHFFSKYWALESGFFDSVAPLVYKWIQAGKDLKDFPLARQSKAASHLQAYNDLDDDDERREYTPYQVLENVAIIPIQGTITPKGDWCAYGIDDMVSWINHANQNDSIEAIVTETDSYGGSVSGIQDLYKAIKNSSKPVVALAANEMHSAAYWGNSGASYIYAGSEHSAFVGSIGVYMLHSEYSKMYEERGIGLTYITSEKAIHKTIGNPHEPLSEEAKGIFQYEVNRIHEAFIADVEAGRKKARGKGNTNYTGGSWDGAECIERGLVDGIAEKGLETAIEKAKELANKAGIKSKNKFSVFI